MRSRNSDLQQETLGLKNYIEHVERDLAKLSAFVAKVPDSIKLYQYNLFKSKQSGTGVINVLAIMGSPLLGCTGIIDKDPERLTQVEYRAVASYYSELIEGLAEAKKSLAEKSCARYRTR